MDAAAVGAATVGDSCPQQMSQGSGAHDQESDAASEGAAALASSSCPQQTGHAGPATHDTAATLAVCNTDAAEASSMESPLMNETSRSCIVYSLGRRVELPAAR